MAIRMMGKTVVRVTTYTGSAMREHGSDRHQRCEVREMLDAIAHSARTPHWGVRVRKAGAK